MHFVLAFIARRRLAHGLLPAGLLFILIKIADPLRVSRGRQPVITARLDSCQVLGVGHATINNDRSIFSFAHPFLQYAEHVSHRSRFAAITGKDFVRFGKTLTVEYQPYNHLFTVRTRAAAVTALRFGITAAQALEIGRVQIVKQDALLERKESLLGGAQS